MIRPPPRSTRTDTLFPYTTLFRSAQANNKLLCLRLCGNSLQNSAQRIFELPRTTLSVHAAFVRSSAEAAVRRSEEHTSELQSLMRISYAVFCLKKKKNKIKKTKRCTNS